MKTSWRYEDDVISITFDPRAVRPAELEKAIEGLGYDAQGVASPPTRKTSGDLQRVSLGSGIPGALQAALERARSTGRLVLVDFWATWCAPCIKLKKTTLEDGAVKELLKRVELVLIDLDEHPDLGRAWGVASVPDVLFLAPDGRVVNRLRKFEDPGAFRQRLEAALSELAANGSGR